MTDEAQVYAEWVLARSFECKKCGYGSTNRRVIEQHLRQSHPDLFEGDPTPTPSPPATPAERGAAQTAPADANGAAKADPPSLAGPSAGSEQSEGGSRRPSSNAGGLDPIFYTDAGTWENGTPRQRSVLAVWDGRIQGVALEEDLPGTTNNEAEYAAIIAALELARNERLSGILIRSDSQLCVRQIKGEWQIKEQRLRPLRDRAARLLSEVRGRIEWVPRERNQAGIYLERKYKK